MGDSVLGDLRSNLQRDFYNGCDSAELLRNIAGHREQAPAYGFHETAKFLLGYFSKPPHSWSFETIRQADLADMAAIIERDGWKQSRGPSFGVFVLLRSLRSIAWAAKEGSPFDDLLDPAIERLDAVRAEVPSGAAKAIVREIDCLRNLPEISMGEDVVDFAAQLDAKRKRRKEIAKNIKKAARDIESSLAHGTEGEADAADEVDGGHAWGDLVTPGEIGLVVSLSGKRVSNILTNKANALWAVPVERGSGQVGHKYSYTGILLGLRKALIPRRALLLPDAISEFRAKLSSLPSRGGVQLGS